MMASEKNPWPRQLPSEAPPEPATAGPRFLKLDS